MQIGTQTTRVNLQSGQQNVYNNTKTGNLFQNIINDKAAAGTVTDNLVGKYCNGAWGFKAEMYATEKSPSTYTLKIMYDDGTEKIREVDAEAIDASDCDILDLFVKLRHLEKSGKCENIRINFVLSHVYMNYREPGANENTKIDFKKWFEQQLELEKSQGNFLSAGRLEKLLLYL